uniref:Putative tumor necrosis factor induced protein n=1 Tax=Ornithodoros turicata TaxID=34597 RepID=A0A2R5LCY3_9ACAR
MTEFKAKDIGLRAQKKLLSHVSNKSVAKVFIDDTAGSLLDNVYRLVKNITGSKKDAEKITKNIIKVVVKVGILHRNSKFSAEELDIAQQFKRKFHSVAMSIVSFHEVEFSYDQQFLAGNLRDCNSLLRNLVRAHLTEKSLGRIDHVFSFFTRPDVLDATFRRDGEHREVLGKIVADLHKSLEEGNL